MVNISLLTVHKPIHLGNYQNFLQHLYFSQMKLCHFIAFLILSTYTFGQEIEKYYTYNWKECEPNEARFYSAIFKTDSGYVRKDYFIHERSLQMVGKYKDQDSKIHDGYFSYFHPNRSLDAIGEYVNDKKSGLWLHYYPNGMPKDSINYVDGNIVGTSLSWHENGYLEDSSIINPDGKGLTITWFDNGNVASAGFIVNNTKPDGIWKYYHKNGQISSREIYKNGILIDKFYFDENGGSVSDTTNKDTDATFPGGIKAWQKYLMKQIYFPNQFKIVNADKAVVVVSFTVNEEGKIEGVHVSTPFYPEFDKIAKKALMNSPDWLPAVKHNRKVKFRMRQPITFKQSD